MGRPGPGPGPDLTAGRSMLLLARVAEQLYWAARYVERAEMTARVVSEHTHLLVDLPTSVPLTWEPLLDVPGTRPPSTPAPTPAATVAADPVPATEREVVAFLLSAPDNPSSVLASVSAARSNLRGAREVLPREAWEAVNNLYLFVTGNHGEGVDRWSRGRFLDRVIAEAQRFDGILAGRMTRGAPYRFLRLGRAVERADMTGRVLDARAVPLLDGPDGSPAGGHREVQWSALLRSLSALPAYYQRGLAPVAGPPAVRLVLHDPDFPGSIGHCLTEAGEALAELPRSTAAATAVASARRTLADVTVEPAARLHDGLLALRSATAAVHDEVQATFFPAPPDPADGNGHDPDAQPDDDTPPPARTATQAQVTAPAPVPVSVPEQPDPHDQPGPDGRSRLDGRPRHASDPGATDQPRARLAGRPGAGGQAGHTGQAGADGRPGQTSHTASRGGHPGRDE